MSQPFTDDAMHTVTLRGKTYAPDAKGVVTIPTSKGDCVCYLASEGLKRKDWYYDVLYRGNHFKHTSRAFFDSALPLIITEGEQI